MASMFPQIGIRVQRTSATGYEIRTAAMLRWVLTGDENPGPNDARYRGRGSIKLRALYWTDGVGVEWPLLSCGNCDLIESGRLAGQSAWSWIGPGYGREGDPVGLWLALDGAALALEIGAVVDGEQLDLRQVVAGYLDAGVHERDASLTFDALSLRQRFVLRALAPYECALVYAGRMEGVSVCTGGIWDGFEASDGTAGQVTSCKPAAQNQYWYPQNPTMVALTSSGHGARLQLELDEPIGPCVVVFNRALADRKLKVYLRPFNNLANPAQIADRNVRTYDHTIRFAAGATS
jgi:hypothetical protein